MMAWNPTALPLPHETPSVNRQVEDGLRYERPSPRMTTGIMLALVIAFLSMHGGGLVVALLSGDQALMLKAFDQIGAASTSVLAVLAALLAPSPLQR
jgi:hypothetical protein